MIKFSFSYKITTTIFKPIVPPSLIIINFYHTPSHCQSSHSRHIEGILKSWGFCNSHFLPNHCDNPFEKMKFNPNFDPAQNPELVSVSNPFTSHYYASSIMAHKRFMSSYIFRLFEKNINEILIFQFPHSSSTPTFEISFAALFISL